jgi:hypothetical protein
MSKKGKKSEAADVASEKNMDLSASKLQYNTKTCYECAHMGVRKHLSKPYPVKPCCTCTLGSRYAPSEAVKARKALRVKKNREAQK